MDLQLKGKRALVTGGTAGIGHAIAQVLAKEGAQVFITGRDRAKLDEAVASLSAAAPGAKIGGIAADPATRDGAAALFAALPEVDILVNNLGIYESKAFTDITDDDWLHIFEVNVLSGVRTARAYLPGMLQRNTGRIIFISSESSLNIPTEMIHYGTTKTAQLSIARGLAELTAGTGVTVNTVLPGPTQSAGIEDFLRSVSSNPKAPFKEIETEFFEKQRPSSLLRRLIDPLEIASLVAWVASPLSAATNGASLRSEGGLLRHLG